MKVSFKYFGVPVGDNHRKKVFWNDMISKIKSKLSSWKGKHLSFAGRVTLIKTVISVVPLYYLFAFKMHTTVGKLMTRLQRVFLWGRGSDKRKIVWIKWDFLCQFKSEGGVEIKDVNLFNMALLGKWKWRLGCEKSGLWKQVLESKYGSWRGLNDSVVSNIESWWWRDIKKVCGGNSNSWFDNQRR